jgi:GT2 family glycosyltransferase
MDGQTRMTAAPRVSICIANYNGTDVIDACIESILAQSFQGLLEILVYDDASPDRSAERIAQRYPQVHLRRGTENRGYCYANNRMAEDARGEYILLLNNDAFLQADAIAVLLKAAEQIGQPAILTLPQYDAVSRQLLDIGSLLDPFLNPIPNRDRHRGDVGLAMGACLWIPRALWQQLGGFPEWLGSIGEDLFLCCRARSAGYPVRALSHSGFFHHVGKSFGGGKVQENKLITTRRRRALSERNKTVVMLACHPGFSVALVGLHAPLLLLEGAALAIIKRDLSLLKTIYWPAVAVLWQESARLRGLRAKVQQGRRASLKSYFSVFRWMPYKLVLAMRHGVPEIR